MEVYAAMLDAWIRASGAWLRSWINSGSCRNTLIFFYAGQRACAETVGRDGKAAPSGEGDAAADAGGRKFSDFAPTRTRERHEIISGTGVMPGPEDTFIGLWADWANVAILRFRDNKHWVMRGGISTPLIVHWPNGLRLRPNCVRTAEPFDWTSWRRVWMWAERLPDELNGNKLLAPEGRACGRRLKTKR